MIDQQQQTSPERMIAVEDRDRLMTPGEVAELFRVDPRTVTRWASRGRIRSVRTIGNQRRFYEKDVDALLKEMTEEAWDVRKRD